MGRTLLGISASPRKLGNCELFIKEIFKQLGEGWELRLARLGQLDIKPCRACYQCLFDEMRCPQQDDFLSVVNALAEADAYVVAAPVYFLSANGSLKRFLDRGLQLYAFVDRLWGKPAAGVAIAGIEGMEGSTKCDVESFIKVTLGDLRWSAVVYGALPGEALLSSANREIAEELALAILDPARRVSPVGPVCPLCGGDTFRFMPDGRARCMLCSGSGPWEWKNESLRFDIESGEHPLFLSKDDVNRHAQWLRGMKEKFLERREELKAVVKEYLGVGTFIERK
ncbi:MAG TPA: flavodoxin family protein [Deltaproteobacteria bacterium]|jgi:multimeric flavodoxin WrbA|nr:flavodoxin family protein [Deltaproteobacteria bacterium]HIJ76577.1 flavodoxin family protein [Deltaproteobacteria bacterium]